MGRKKSRKKAAQVATNERSSLPSVERSEGLEDDEKRFQEELELALRLSKEEEMKKSEHVDIGAFEKWNMQTSGSITTGNSENDFEEVSGRKGKRTKKKKEQLSQQDSNPYEILEKISETPEVEPVVEEAKVRTPPVVVIPPKETVWNEEARRRELKLADFLREPRKPKEVIPPTSSSSSGPLNYSAVVSQRTSQRISQPPTPSSPPSSLSPQTFPPISPATSRPPPAKEPPLTYSQISRALQSSPPEKETEDIIPTEKEEAKVVNEVTESVPRQEAKEFPTQTSDFPSLEVKKRVISPPPPTSLPLGESQGSFSSQSSQSSQYSLFSAFGSSGIFLGNMSSQSPPPPESLSQLWEASPSSSASASPFSSSPSSSLSPTPSQDPIPPTTVPSDSHTSTPRLEGLFTSSPSSFFSPPTGCAPESYRPLMNPAQFFQPSRPLEPAQQADISSLLQFLV